MKVITRTLIAAAFITAVSTATAGRGPEIRINSAPKSAAIVQDTTVGNGAAKHGGRHGHRASEIKATPSSKAKSMKQASKANWNFRSYR